MPWEGQYCTADYTSIIFGVDLCRADMPVSARATEGGKSRPVLIGEPAMWNDLCDIMYPIVIEDYSLNFSDGWFTGFGILNDL